LKDYLSVVDASADTSASDPKDATKATNYIAEKMKSTTILTIPLVQAPLLAAQYPIPQFYIPILPQSL